MCHLGVPNLGGAGGLAALVPHTLCDLGTGTCDTPRCSTVRSGLVLQRRSLQDARLGVTALHAPAGTPGPLDLCRDASLVTFYELPELRIMFNDSLKNTFFLLTPSGPILHHRSGFSLHGMLGITHKRGNQEKTPRRSRGGQGQGEPPLTVFPRRHSGSRGLLRASVPV